MREQVFKVAPSTALFDTVKWCHKSHMAYTPYITAVSAKNCSS